MTHSGVTLNLTARGWGVRNANSKNGLVYYPTLHISKVTHIVTHSGVTLNLTTRGRRARNATGKMVLFVILPFIYQKWLTKWLTSVTHIGVTLNLITWGWRARNANTKNGLVCYFTLWEPKKALDQPTWPHYDQALCLGFTIHTERHQFYWDRSTMFWSRFDKINRFN